MAASACIGPHTVALPWHSLYITNNELSTMCISFHHPPRHCMQRFTPCTLPAYPAALQDAHHAECWVTWRAWRHAHTLSSGTMQGTLHWLGLHHASSGGSARQLPASGCPPRSPGAALRTATIYRVADLQHYHAGSTHARDSGVMHRPHTRRISTMQRSATRCPSGALVAGGSPAAAARPSGAAPTCSRANVPPVDPFARRPGLTHTTLPAPLPLPAPDPE